MFTTCVVLGAVILVQEGNSREITRSFIINPIIAHLAGLVC